MTDRDAGGLLRQVARLYLQLQRAGAAGCGGTTATQCFIISELGRGGPMTLAELGRRLNLEKSWLSRAVETLARQGLLVKRPSAADRRAIVISLSAAGTRRYRALNEVLDAQAGRVLSHIAERERPGVLKALQLLCGALQDEAASGSVSRGGGSC